MITFRPATEQDAAYVGVHLRESDRLEVERGSGNAPSEAPLKALRASIIAWTMVSTEGVPLAVFGAAPDKKNQQTGIIWLLGTPEVNRKGKTLVAKGRHYVALMAKLFPRCLHNCVDADNSATRRWLRALGFDEGEYACPGPTGHPFIYVYYPRYSNV